MSMYPQTRELGSWVRARRENRKDGKEEKRTKKDIVYVPRIQLRGMDICIAVQVRMRACDTNTGVDVVCERSTPTQEGEQDAVVAKTTIW